MRPSQNWTPIASRPESLLASLQTVGPLQNAAASGTRRYLDMPKIGFSSEAQHVLRIPCFFEGGQSTSVKAVVVLGVPSNSILSRDPSFQENIKIPGETDPVFEKSGADRQGQSCVCHEKGIHLFEGPIQTQLINSQVLKESSAVLKESHKGWFSSDFSPTESLNICPFGGLC